MQYEEYVSPKSGTMANSDELFEVAEITALFKETFTNSEGTEEGATVSTLAKELLITTAPELLRCFVAKEVIESKEVFVGAVIFTKLTFEDDTQAALLSPMAIATAYQGRGIGQKLIRHGLNILKEAGVTVVCTYGDLNFYGKIGFAPLGKDRIQPPHKLSYPQGWIGQSLVTSTTPKSTGVCSCVSALNKPSLW